MSYTLNQVQLDELYAVLSAVRDGDVSEAEAIERLSRSPHWVWTAIDPETKVLLSVQVGERTLAMAQAVLHQITQLLAPGCVPLFLSDGYPHYLTAIVTHFGYWVQPPRRQARGPVPKPRWMPLPALLYAQVVKTHATAAHRRGQAPRGVWHESGGGAGLGRLRLADQHGVCREAQSEPASAGRGDWTAQRHARVRAKTACASNWCCSRSITTLSCPMPVCARRWPNRSHQWHGLRQGMAAVYASDGGGIDGPCVVAERGVALSGATVAPAADGLRNGAS